MPVFASRLRWPLGSPITCGACGNCLWRPNDGTLPLRMGPSILKSWLVGVVTTIVILALASSPLIVIVLSSIGLPYSISLSMLEDISEIMRIRPTSAVGLWGPPLLAGFICSVFYGGLAYVALVWFKSRKRPGAQI
jgi:hypothetical protein